MKLIRIMVILVFAAIILAPVAAFHLKEDAISVIDNRALAANPFSDEASGDLTDGIENYVNDRIGFRDEMILSYTVLHDVLFGEMVHPSYSYGKTGYVFGAGITVDAPFTEYHEAFADMVKQIQEYCAARNVPFLFVFNPAKPAVLYEYIPDGIHYDRSWVDGFFAALEQRNVNYLDNTGLLREKTLAGEVVFNQKFDANHWNDLGAYYGTNAMPERLQSSLPTVHVNELRELTISQTLQTSLPVSEFPIHEMVPEITVDMEVCADGYDKYRDELEMHPSFRGFGYYSNEKRASENAPKALAFQGSYMNNFGYKYLANGFSEYIYVHDYQNIIDFAYYFNIFKPDCVIFEVAEYTFNETYFSYDGMVSMDLNPTLQTAAEEAKINTTQILPPEEITVSLGEDLTKITWETQTPARYAWCRLDTAYDMKRSDNGYEATVPTEVYLDNQDELEIVLLDGETLCTYQSA